MAPDTPADGLTAELERLSAIEQAADPGPWTVSARHGIDISDEGWSEVSIVTGGGATVAMTFLSHVLEPDRDDENAEFIAEARTAMPRLVAAIQRLSELADEWEQEGFRLDAEAFMNCAKALREAITQALSGNPGAQEAQQREEPDHA